MSLTKENIYQFLIILIILTFSITAFIYGERVHSSYLRADEWRFLDIYLLPIYDGAFGWKLLFTDQHGTSLDGIVFIINALYFDLTGDLFFYIGIFSKILILMLFAVVLKRNFSDKPNYYVFALLVIGTTFFSLKGTTEYQWPLVMRANLFILMFLGILYFIDKYLKADSKNTKYAFVIFVISIVLLLSVKTAGIIFLGSIIGLLFMLTVADNQHRAKFLNLIGIFIFALISIKLFWMAFCLDASRDVPNKIDFSSFSILSFIQSYGLALLSGLVGSLMFLKKSNHSLILLFSYFYLFSYFVIIFYSIKLKIYKKSIIPLALMIYPLLFILGVLMFRYFPVQGEINWLVISPRYVSTYELGTVGLLWNILLIFYGLNLPRLKNIMFYSLMYILILVNVYYMRNSFNTSKYFVNANKKVENVLYNYINGNIENIPKTARGGHFTDKKVDFLKENKLNVFSEKYNKIEKR